MRFASITDSPLAGEIMLSFLELCYLEYASLEYFDGLMTFSCIFVLPNQQVIDEDNVEFYF